MDLLSLSCRMICPEQTRVMHLMEQHPNDLSLGFDACTCGEILNIRSGSDLYSRVKYCSDAYGRTSRTACYDSEEGEEDTAMESPSIGVLQLCDDDFDTEDGKASQR
jgi:hypothetical protein